MHTSHTTVDRPSFGGGGGPRTCELLAGQIAQHVYAWRQYKQRYLKNGS